MLKYIKTVFKYVHENGNNILKPKKQTPFVYERPCSYGM